MNAIKHISIAIVTIFSIAVTNAQQPINKEDFKIINLNYHGLEKTKQLVNAGNYDEAAKELLSYYRKRVRKNIDQNKTISKADQEKADNALLHKFQPQKGYGFFDYGKDINWQYWPVKDNEVRWQLHRMYWWQPMGKAYLVSGDEKYAKEWVFQFRDWVKKNPLGLSKENDSFAWRPLEVSERIMSLPETFDLFVESIHFTPGFLLEFLKSYSQQANYIPQHYSDRGNHLLFEAQRVVTAGSFFPELKDAESWRKSGIEVLNTEIKKQVYPDGMQWELSPVYHNASINIFLNAYLAAQQSGIEKEFPDSYRTTIEKMILATINISYPDYNMPMFGDSWMIEKKTMLNNFKTWSEVFPKNKWIQYFASDYKNGEKPNWLSNALKTGGFYTFRNGWDEQATVMVLKASPPGEFHAQPDNGTFELWVKGRLFTPDAGCYVYSGDEEVMKMRDWFRQTRVHSTLTIDNKNMVITKAELNKWQTSKNLDILTYTNPSYSNLNHQRSVLFIDQKYFLIIDHAIGTASGKIGVHFQLKEDSEPVYDSRNNSVFTTYKDGNNLLIQSLNKDKVSLSKEESKVSYQYRKKITRPGFVFEKEKGNGEMQTFATVLYPFSGTQVPKIRIITNRDNNWINGKIDVVIMVDGKAYKINTSLF